MTEIPNDASAPPLKTIARKRVKAANALKTHEEVPKTTGRKRKIQMTGSENPVKRSRIASASEESVTEEPQPLDGLRPHCEAQIPHPTNQLMTAAAPSPIVLPQMKPLRRRRGKATHEDEVCPKIPAARISHRNQDGEHEPDDIFQTETVKARKGRRHKESVALNALPLESTEATTTGKHARKTRVKRGRKKVAATASEEEEAAAAAEGEGDPPHPPSSPAEGPKDPPTKALEDSAPAVVPAPSRRRGRKPKSQQSNNPPKTTPRPPSLLDDVVPPYQSSHQHLTKAPSPQATPSQRSLSPSSAQPPPTLPYTITNTNNDPPPPLPHQISLRAHLSHIIKSHQGLPARLSALEAEAKRLRGTNSPSKLGFKETREEIEGLLKRMEGVLRKGGEMLKERGKEGKGREGKEREENGE